MSDLTRCNITFRLSSPDPVQNAGDAAWFFPSKDEYLPEGVEAAERKEKRPSGSRIHFGAKDDDNNDNSIEE